MAVCIDSLEKIVGSIEFWKIALPALGAILAWWFNERTKRLWEQYKRKEESYKNLILGLRGFYQGIDNIELKSKFLGEVNLCWLYAPDEVIQKAYNFLDTTNVQREPISQEAKKQAAGALVLAIRKDLLSSKLVRDTELNSGDFKHLGVTPPRT